MLSAGASCSGGGQQPSKTGKNMNEGRKKGWREGGREAIDIDRHLIRLMPRT
jgi:hypothetical protein